MPPQPKKHSLSSSQPHHPGRNPYSSSSAGSAKPSRLDSGTHGGHSSGAVRKKQSSASSASSAPARTGQACDRCKVRKIRCDNTLGGCIPCRQNNVECKTTDRITHRATARGHTENLERDNTQLAQHIKELEQQVLDLGGSPKQPPHILAISEHYAGEWAQTASSGRNGSWAESSVTSGSDNRERQPELNVFSLPTNLPPEGGPDHYLGFRATPSELGSSKATSLSLFGMHLDLMDFMPMGATDIENPRSYRTLFELIRVGMSGKGESYKVNLANSYEECMHHIELYIKMANVAMPLVHPPQIRELIHRIYYQGHEPTAQESVMLHSMLAWIKYQFAARNDEKQTRDLAAESDMHYHYALVRYQELVLHRTLETVQAMTLLCAHVRNFPMPETAWMTGSWAMQIAIDMGLHRSAGPWPHQATKEDKLRIEMRKRIFWVLFLFMIALSGKLGRPMPMHVGDYDIEFPEFVNENMERLEPGKVEKECPFYGAVFLFKRVELLCETYGTIYSLQPIYPYEETVERIDRKLKKLNSQLPTIPAENIALLDNEQKSRSMLANQVHRAVAEVELVLHHPALCQSTSPKLISKNLGACVEAANRLIRATVQLMAFNAIDSTWYSTTSFIAAIFTLLFAIEQRNQLSDADLLNLRSDMSVCLEVFANIGRMLGTGLRLRDKMAEIIHKALERITRRQMQRTAPTSNEQLRQTQAHNPNMTQSEFEAQIQAHSQTPARTQGHAQSQNNPFKQEPVNSNFQGHLTAGVDQDHSRRHSSRQDSYISASEAPLTQHQAAAYGPVSYGPQSSVEPVAQPYQYNQYASQGGVYHSMADMTHGSVSATDPFMYPPGALGSSNAWHQWAQVAREPGDNTDYSNALNPAAALMALGGHGGSSSSEAPHHSAPPAHDLGYNIAGGLAQSGNSTLPNLMHHQVPSTAMHMWPMTAWQSDHGRANQ